jgi:hypothetical protein
LKTPLRHHVFSILIIDALIGMAMAIEVHDPLKGVPNPWIFFPICALAFNIGGIFLLKYLNGEFVKKPAS